MLRSCEGFFFPIRSKSAQGRPTGVSVLTRTFLKQNSDGEFNETKFWRTRKASFKEVKSDSRLWKYVPVLSSDVYCSNVFLLACCREQAPVLRFSSVFVSCMFTCPKGTLPPPCTKAGSSSGGTWSCTGKSGAGSGRRSVCHWRAITFHLSWLFSSSRKKDTCTFVLLSRGSLWIL